MFKEKRFLSFILAFMLTFSIISGIVVEAKEDLTHITILGTTDLHGQLYNWSYEDAVEKNDRGLTKVYSAVEHFRKENPNTILIDNGDTIQGTIMTDDLYNMNLDWENPMIKAMNFMGYDAMTLGNHEFNFGLDLIEKIEKEADFPLLAANIKYKENGESFVKPYTIKEVAGVKVGIIGFAHKNVPNWDGDKVKDLEFSKPVEAMEEYIEELREKTDIIIASSHANLEADKEGHASRDIVDAYPEIAALMVGHSHGTVEEKIGNTPVGGARDAGKELVKFDLYLRETKDGFEIVESEVEVIETKDFEASEELKEVGKEAHEKTQEFINEVLGVALDDFQPENEIKGIPEAQIRDTALIDLINNVQLKVTGADVAGAALFQTDSKLEKGNINYANIFNIYKYPNTIVATEVTGAQLKAYLEWSARYYNTWKPGDINISFNENIRGYGYDMLQGVDYKIDISKPEGERIVEMKIDGKDVQPEDKIKLAMNNYRFDKLVGDGILDEDQEIYFNSEPKALRSYIAEYIREVGELEPVVDNNWELVGYDLNHPAREYIVQEINKGNIVVPTTQDGRTPNIKAFNADEMLKEGIIPENYAELIDKKDIEIKVDGETINIPDNYGKPYIKDDITLVPLRAVIEKLGHKVNWDRVARTVTIDERIVLTIDSKKVLVDGKEMELEVPATIKGDNRTYIPIRFISESLGYEVNWDETNKIVIINTTEEVKPAA